MSPDRWERLEALFTAALERPVEERAVYVAAAREDPDVGSEVLALLQAHEGRGRLDSIADQLAGLRPAAASAAVADLLDRLRTALAGRYRIDRELGRGGMAIVLLAEDLKLRRKVALKILQPDIAPSIGPARFLQEIAIAAQLAHPHILPLHDSGEADGLLYYVMPYVEGESLRDRLRREGRLPLQDALQIARQVADALSHAHGHGVVHRDIKPENILLEAGHAVVSDFGIARAMSAAGGDELRETGVLGTPAYMSPEQAAGGDVDQRSDLYSLGCVLYEMLAGEPPFTGATAESVLHQHLADPPPDLPRPAVPEAVRAAIRRALAKAPAERFTTAVQFATALPLPGAVAAPPPARRRRVRASVALAAAAIVFMGGMVVVARFRKPAALDPELIAVAPFGILDPKLELWHEGLVDVLSRNLDGAGPFRTASPTLVIRRWQGRADRGSAEGLAHRTGAGLVLFGQLSSVGADSVRLRAALLDARNDRTLTEIDRRDRAERIDGLADSVSLNVIRTLAATTRGIRIRLFSVGTRSLPALKAFLRGEQLLRRFSLDSAIEAYEGAVEDDGNFALALRRLGLVRGWRGQSGQALGLKAGRSNHGLALRDSLLIVADSLEAASDDPLDSAYWSHRVRKFSTLEEASRRYPDDPEVWYSLGEARFHLGYAVGGTAAQALDAFDRAIGLDSAFAPAYVHPVQLALDRNDTAAAKRYIRGYVGLTSGVPEGAGLRLVGLLVDRASVKSTELQSIIDTASTNVLFDAWRSVQRWPDSSEAGVRLLRLLVGGRRGVGVSADTATTRYLLATEVLYRGHLREAGRLIGSRVSVPYGELALLGIVPADSANVAFDRWLRSPNERATVADPPWVTRCYRSFLAAGWWARRQDTLPLLTLMRRGDSVARSAGTVVKVVDARADANLARAALALARRDTADALRRFLAFPDSLCSHQYGSLAPSLAPLHMVRFELLAATGRDREAALLFDRQVTIPLNTGSVMATLERGRIAERLGDRASAVQHYRFVVSVWANADPELRPHVEQAYVGLQRLGVALRRRGLPE